MKKLILLLLITLSLQGFSQDWDVIRYEGKTAEEIQTAIKSWIVLNYNSAQTVIQQDDPGKIILKGLFTIQKHEKKYGNTFSFKINHVLSFEIRDERFRYRIYPVTVSVYDSPSVTLQEYEKSIEISEKELPNVKGRIAKEMHEFSLNASKETLKETKDKLESIKLSIQNIPNQKADDDDW